MLDYPIRVNSNLVPRPMHKSLGTRLARVYKALHTSLS